VSVFARLARRAAIGAGTLAAGGALLVATIPFWQHGGANAAGPIAPTAIAKKGDMTVSVGGVGRVVIGSVDSLAVPTGSSTQSSSGQSGSTMGAGAVFPHMIGHVGRILVRPGQVVRAGQLLAVLDDNGVAESTLAQSTNDAAVAELELRLKQSGDPSTGRPPTPQEIAAGSAAVRAAQAKLRRLRGPGGSPDVTTARADLSKAIADLAVLRRPPTHALGSAIQAARLAIVAATEKLRKVSAQPDSATIAAAQADLAKAKSDLAALTRPVVEPLPEELAAAEQAIKVAEDRVAVAKSGKNPFDLDAANADLAKARADLALLKRPKQAPLPEEVDNANAAIVSAQARLDLVIGPRDPSELATANADLARAESELETLLRLPPAALPAQIAAAERTVSAARTKLTQLARAHSADVVGAQAEVRRAKADLVVLKARGGPATPLEIQLARERLLGAQLRTAAARQAARMLEIRSPHPGTVTSLLTVPGAPVDGTTPIATVVDLGHLEVAVDLSEFDIAQVHPGLPASVSVDALGGKVVPGRVAFASPTGSSANGVVTFPVRIALTRSAGLRPGMNVSVRILVARRHGVLQVPLDAVTQNADGEPVVTVVTDGKSVEQPVELGLSSNKRVEILDGVLAGQHVLVLPDHGQQQDEEQ
jgi:RND family efflux transporter MFP subunit